MGISLAWICAMETAGVLNERALPSDGHRQEQRVEPRIVEAFAYVASGREHQSRFVIGKLCEVPEGVAACAARDPAMEHDEVWQILAKRLRKPIEMVAPFRQDHHRASLVKQVASVRGYELKPVVVRRNAA
jgi:hypothetical protein